MLFSTYAQKGMKVGKLDGKHDPVLRNVRIGRENWLCVLCEPKLIIQDIFPILPQMLFSTYAQKGMKVGKLDGKICANSCILTVWSMEKWLLRHEVNSLHQ